MKSVTTRVLCAAVLMVVGFVAPQAVLVAHAAVPTGARPLKIVQLGDSYSAGNGAGAYTGPRKCYRSGENWGSRYTRYLRDLGREVTYINRACSGAVIDNVLNDRDMDDAVVLPTLGVPVAGEHHLNADGSVDTASKAALEAVGCRTPYSGDEFYDFHHIDFSYESFTDSTLLSGYCERFMNAQINAIGPTVDLVLLTIGGNDLAFIDIVKQCFIVGSRDPGDCRGKVEAAESSLPTTRVQIESLLTKLRAKLRPDAHVALLSYPLLSSRDDYTLRSLKDRLPFVTGDTYEAGRKVRELGIHGEAAQKQAVLDANAAAGVPFTTYVDTVIAAFEGPPAHEPDPGVTSKNPDRWIVEPTDTAITATWYHPNSLGHEAEKDQLLPYGDFGLSEPTVAADVDISFVVDTTGSMSGEIGGVQNELSSVIDTLSAGGGNYRFSLVTYKDHPEAGGDIGDYPSRVDLPFTADTLDMHAAVDALFAAGGGDIPESAYSGMEAALNLDWRPGVKKFMIVIGDAPAKDPEPITGLTADSIVAHAAAIDPVEVDAIDASGFGGLGSEITDVATRTGGMVRDGSAGDFATALADTVTSAVDKPYAWAGGPYTAQIGSELTLDASGSFSASSVISSYEWDLDGDGVYETTTDSPLLNHTFASAFTGLVAVRVTDANGETAVGTTPAHITRDGDEVEDAVDNCPDTANPGQEDTDDDGTGDACDATSGYPSEDQAGVTAYNAVTPTPTPTPTPPAATPVAPPAAPSPPVAIRATAGNRSVLVHVTPAADPSVTGWHVSVKPGNSSYDIPANRRDLKILGLRNGAAYTMTVTSTSASGRSAGLTRTARPRLPRLDFNGDSRAEAAAYSSTSGKWTVRGGKTFTLPKGGVPVAADYDGQGTTDAAVYVAKTGLWTVAGHRAVRMAKNGVPVAVDTNGDGKAEMSVYTPATGRWSVRGLAHAVSMPARGIPIAGDVTGDGRTDLTVYAPKTGKWTVAKHREVQRAAGGLPVLADTNGDGKAELTVYLASRGQWAVPGKPKASVARNGVPVAGDPLGDGRERLGV